MDLSMETGMKIANSIEASEYHWGRKKVLALITSVEEFFEDFYDKSLKKKHTWKNVADHMQGLGYTCSSVACEKKWRALKGSYAQALQRQLQGDTSSSFKYFDDLHHILGQEVEPEGSSDESGRMEDDIPDAPYSPEPAEHEDLTNDDGYMWGTEETHLLLDYIMESKKSFSSPNVPLSAVWEDIASEMSHVGDQVTSEQCQRKWIDLKEGLKVNQAKTEAMGVMPLWPHYARTQEVASAVDVRTILSTPVKKEKRIRVKSEKELKSSSKKRDDRSSKATKPKAGKRKTILERVKSMESSLSVQQRLERLEARMEVSRQQQEAAKKTNVLLVQVLAELRRINAAVKQEESMEGVQGVQAHPSDPLACNPANQEFIIVEAIADQL